MLDYNLSPTPPRHLAALRSGWAAFVRSRWVAYLLAIVAPLAMLYLRILLGFTIGDDLALDL